MPSIALEVGNLTSAESAMALADPAFQAKLANAAAAAIERYATMRQAGAF
jgi:N-acetylmuramoyl-L-alanine amidase